jgi:hypothetical protein
LWCLRLMFSFVVSTANVYLLGFTLMFTLVVSTANVYPCGVYG